MKRRVALAGLARWPLCALEKVLPFDVAATADPPTVAGSLERRAAVALQPGRRAPLSPAGAARLVERLAA